MASTSVVFDILARDRASDKFDHLGHSVDGSSSKMSKFTGVMKTAGRAAAYGLGAGLVLAAGAAVKFTKAAADDAQQQEILRGALERNANATDLQVASTERWIAAQGRAKGVADDDLRPALAALVTATHDVSEAQDLAGLAMDVSAARGKSLQTVSEALMKAQNGNVAVLGKLGINVKNAAGETITMTQAVARMSDQFGGAATEKANTFSGKIERLKLMASETAESIGGLLLPYATKFADYLLSTAVPNVEKFIHQMERGRGEGGRFADKLRDIRDVLKSASKFVLDHKEDIAKLTAGYFALRTALRVATGAQILLNVAMAANPIGLIIVAVAGLAAGFVYAYKHSERFRSAVDRLRTIFIDTTFKAISFAVAVKDRLVGAMASLIALPSRVAGAFARMASVIQGVLAAIGGAIDSVKSKVGGLLSALGNAASAGSGGVLGHILPRSVAEGAGEKAGQWYVTGFIKGLGKQRQQAADYIGGLLTDQLTSARSALAALRDRKNEFANFSGFSGNVFGADISGGTDGTGPTGVAALLAFQAKQRASAEQLSKDVALLIGKGLSNDLIEELKDSGAQGEAQIHALASASAAEIAQLNADHAAEQAALAQAGQAAASKVFDQQLAVMGAGVTELARTTAQIVGRPIVIEMHQHYPNGKVVVQAIKVEERATGKKYLVD